MVENTEHNLMLEDETSQFSVISNASLTSDAEFNMSDNADRKNKNEFNKSMLSLDKTWSPIKFQLNSNIDTVSKKLKQKIINKATKAIDLVLEPLAPGQSNQLKNVLFKEKDKEKDESRIVNLLKEAINNTDGRNTRIQLLTVFCNKDTDDSYLYSRTELINTFDNVTEYDIRQVRERCSQGAVGIPVEPGKFHRKKLSDARSNQSFLRFPTIRRGDSRCCKWNTYC